MWSSMKDSRRSSGEARVKSYGGFPVKLNLGMVPIRSSFCQPSTGGVSLGICTGSASPANR